MVEAQEHVAATQAERPAGEWFNRFRVLDPGHLEVLCEGIVLTPGDYDDVNRFPSRDAAETFAIERLAAQKPEVRQFVMWLGAFPVEADDGQP
ncbi:MAG: hypothetical protein AB7O04_16830 [Hyphomonadaceae bacterium]